MLNQGCCSIENVVASAQALTDADLAKVMGGGMGVMMDEEGRGCTERNLPDFSRRPRPLSLKSGIRF